MVGGENLPEVSEMFDSLSGQVRSLFGAEGEPAEEHAELLVGDWMKLDAQRANGSRDQQAGMIHRAFSSSHAHGGREEMDSRPGGAALVRAPGGEQQRPGVLSTLQAAGTADPASSREPGSFHGFVRRTSAGSRAKDLPLVRVPVVSVSPAPRLRARRVSCLTTATLAPRPLSSPAGKLA